MTVNIEAATDERCLLEDERYSLINLIQDEINPLPHIEHKRALIRLAVVENSINYLESMIMDELLSVPLDMFNANTTTDELE